MSSSGQFQGGPPAAEMMGGGSRTRLSVVPRYGEADFSSSVAARPRIKVLVVGGQALFVDSLAIALGADPGIEIVGTETDPELAPARLRRVKADIVLLNQAFADRDCAALISRLRAEDHAL